MGCTLGVSQGGREGGEREKREVGGAGSVHIGLQRLRTVRNPQEPEVVALVTSADSVLQ